VSSLRHGTAAGKQDQGVARFALWAFTVLLPFGFIWAEVLLQFGNTMIPRLRNMLLGGPILNTPPCATPNCDFSVFWPAGLLARSGDYTSIYHTDLFLSWREKLFSSGVQRLDWFYPPPSLLPVMAISYLPFNAAFFVWIGFFFIAAAALLRWAGLSRLTILAGLLSPAALWSAEMGQFEVLSNAILVAGLMMLERAPRRSGILLGLLVIQPQTGLLIPICILARRDWKVLVSGALLVVLLLAATFLLFGPRPWLDYWHEGLSASGVTLTTNTVGFERGVSVFWMVRSLGGSLTQCGILQGGASLLAAAAAVWLWCHPAPVRERMALTVFLALLLAPFGYVDDMVAWSIALAVLAEARGWRFDLLDALFWLWPALCPIVQGWTGVLLTPLVVVLAVIRTWRGMSLVPLCSVAG
jgi:alpha-1,2-mannosyltransferase